MGQLPVFISVHITWHDIVDVCACANQEEDNKEEGLEVEERGLANIRFPGISGRALDLSLP